MFALVLPFGLGFSVTIRLRLGLRLVLGLEG